MPVELNITESVTELDTTVVTVTLESASEPGPAGPGVPVGGTAGQVLTKDSGADYDTSWQDSAGGGGGAPDDATYLVTTAHDDLSAEVVVGATPGGELGGTWASPTVDATHSGSSHASVQAAAEATAAAALLAHTTDSSDAHDASAISIADAGGDFTATDVEGALAELQSDHETDAQNLTDHAADTTSVHGIADMNALALSANVPSNATFNDHSARHENGGADEISVAGLSGELADTQPTEASKVDSGAASDGDVLTADGAGGAAWEAPESGGSTDGWIADSDTWTYASASTFTVSGDVTARFSKGTRLKFTQTTVKYAVVVASNHAAGTTTVTIAVNTDYTLANAAISATYYSYDVNPQGYPATFAYTPAWTSSGTQPAIVNGTITGSFSIVGNMCDVKVNISMGGSTTFGTGTYSISYPVTEVTGGVEANGMCLLFDSSTSGFYPAMWRAGSLMQLATVPSSFAANNAPFTWASSDQMQLQNRYRI